MFLRNLILFTFISLTTLNFQAFAETIILKSGESVEGLITDRTDEYVWFQTNDDKLRVYYFNEIKTIDGFDPSAVPDIQSVEYQPPAQFLSPPKSLQAGYFMPEDLDRILGALGGFAQFAWLIIVFAWIILSLPIMIIAMRTEPKNAILAFVPVAQFYLLIKISEKPMWWFFLQFVPFANIFIVIPIWMAIADRLGHNRLLGVFVFIPLIGPLVQWYMAIVEKSDRVKKLIEPTAIS